MKNPTRILLPFILSVTFLGCPPPAEIKKEAPPPPAPEMKRTPGPEITIHLATLDVGALNRRVERKDIQQLAAVLKREGVDILAISGIVRYPGVSSRLDPVDELSSQTQMPKTFGETATVSGRQTGNAVFTIYPVRSHVSTLYEGLESEEFAAALQTVIDCGPQNLVIISTHLPANASEEDRLKAVRALNRFRGTYETSPVIVAGNIPPPEEPYRRTPYALVQQAADSTAPLLWYTNDGSLKLIESKTRLTSLGTVVVSQFGVFRGRTRRP